MKYNTSSINSSTQQGPRSNKCTSAQQNNATSASAQQKDPTSAQAHNNIVLQRLDEMGKF